MVDAEDYFIGPDIDITRMNILEPGDLLTAIRIPSTWAGAQFYFEKVRDRNVWDFPLVNVASAMKMSGDNIQRHPHRGEWRGGSSLAIEGRRRCRRGKPRTPTTGEMAGKLAIQGAKPLQYNAYKIPLMRNLVKRAIGGVRGGSMGSISGRQVRGASSPHPHCLGSDVGGRDRRHAVPGRPRDLCPVLRPRRRNSPRGSLRAVRGAIPARVPRHSLAARLFHWIMAVSMLRCSSPHSCRRWACSSIGSLTTGLPESCLTVSVLYHVIHATFCLDFWSIWPDKTDLEDAWNRILRFLGKPRPRRGNSPNIPWRTSSIMVHHLLRDSP